MDRILPSPAQPFGGKRPDRLSRRGRHGAANRLIGFWQCFAAKEFGVTLAVDRLKVSEPTLRDLWRGLCRALDGKSITTLAWTGLSAIGLWPTRRPPCASLTLRHHQAG